MNFDEAIAAHEEYKLNLKKYLQNKSSQKYLNPSLIAKDDICSLGKWIYKKRSLFKFWSKYEELIIEHAKFHQYSAEIVKEINSGFIDTAKELMSFNSDYTKSSFNCINLIKELREVSFFKSDFQKILKSNEMVGLNEVLKLFKSNEPSLLIQIIRKEKNNEIFVTNLVYYCYVFQKEPAILILINHEDFPEDLLLKIIYYNYGKWIMSGNDADLYFENAMISLQHDKNLSLLLNANLLELDLYLALHLLGNLNISGIDLYFAKVPNLDDVLLSLVKVFQAIEENDRRNFFLRYPDVYGYILLVMATFNQKQAINEFIIKNEENIQLLDKLILFKNFIKEQFNLENKIGSSLQEKEGRLKLIINQINKFKNLEEVIDILYNQRFFINEEEKNIVKSILTDPYLKEHILNHLSDNKIKLIWIIFD